MIWGTRITANRVTGREPEKISNMYNIYNERGTLSIELLAKTMSSGVVALQADNREA